MDILSPRHRRISAQNPERHLRPPGADFLTAEVNLAFNQMPFALRSVREFSNLDVASSSKAGFGRTHGKASALGSRAGFAAAQAKIATPVQLSAKYVFN